MCLNVLLLQIATLIRLHFDMSGVKGNVEVEYLQLNILTWDEYLSVVGWAVAAIVLAVLSIAMAFSAAVQVTHHADGSCPCCRVMLRSSLCSIQASSDLIIC